MGTSEELDTTPVDPEAVPIPVIPHYCKCSVIHQDGSVREGAVNVERLMSVDEAVVALRHGMRAWVAVGSADMVLASWRNYGDRG